MNEAEINARLNSLVEQRNNALNTVVILQGNLAVAQAEMEQLNSQLQQAWVKIEDLQNQVPKEPPVEAASEAFDPTFDGRLVHVNGGIQLCAGEKDLNIKGVVITPQGARLKESQDV